MVEKAQAQAPAQASESIEYWRTMYLGAMDDFQRLRAEMESLRAAAPAQAQGASHLWPRNTVEPSQGWTLDMKFLKAIKHEVNKEWSLDCEEIESVLLAAESLAAAQPEPPAQGENHGKNL
jgi:hypothetical protein